jgi:oxalate decarboxylase/phosphoglucose isomerase-like protein (cupin superfamily)
MTTDLSKAEIANINTLLSPILNPAVYHFGSDDHKPRHYDKRENMYGGDGTVYLLQMFDEGELVNNRIGAFMVLPTSEDSCSFHTHGTRNEQEIYLVMSGQGEYLEKDQWENEARTFSLEKGNLTTVRGEAFHAVQNTGDEPLVIFVITTNEPER